MAIDDAPLQAPRLVPKGAPATDPALFEPYLRALRADSAMLRERSRRLRRRADDLRVRRLGDEESVVRA
jgi:hypothetical protein